MPEYSFSGLFLVSFGAATVLPVSSEAVFALMILSGYDAWGCILTAAVGNWLGGMTNYYLGRFGKTQWIEKYLKISSKQIKKVQKMLQGRSAATAFFSFLPVVGDVIALVLGLLRANLFIVNVTMFLGKLLRYIFLWYGLEYAI